MNFEWNEAVVCFIVNFITENICVMFSERFGNMTRVYYKDALGAIIVYDVTRRDTFKAVDKWKSDLDSKVLLPDGRPIPCILVGNKADMKTEEELEADQPLLKAYCQQKGIQL